MPSDRPFLLIVLDGFGCRDEEQYNAIHAAETPVFDRLYRECAWTTIEASGLNVGLPDGQMGNSEVGHLNIGAGRVIDQDIVRISKAAKDGTLARNPLLSEIRSELDRSGGRLHFVGLLSDGGVHSLQEHLHGLIRSANDAGFGRDSNDARIIVHAILDGRDTPPVSALANLDRLLKRLEVLPQVRLGSVIGRYYSMDRDNRWDRVKRGYELMTQASGTRTSDPRATVQKFYDEGRTDEFMEPIWVEGGEPVRDGDVVVFFNFRADRMRQIVTAFKDESFEGFERSVRPNAKLASLVRYHEDFDLPVLFPPVEVKGHLGHVLSAAGRRQLRIAETEKYAHVTFFFNGGSDEPSAGEERILIPSAKVATYDLKPEMSVRELADRVASEIASRKFDFIVLNIANPDMVGHTGVMDAAVKAVAETDSAVGKILNAIAAAGGAAMITADHGNCEVMFDTETNQPHTAHTTNAVPLILVEPEGKAHSLAPGGSLENVAPTILDYLGIEKSPEMTAESLLIRGSV